MIRRGQELVVKVRSSKVKEIDDFLFIGTLGIDCLEYSRRCIDSVRSNAKSVTFNYMDNGSTEENVEIIKGWEANNTDIDQYFNYINGSNIGVGPGWNALIKRGIALGATKILICNNDIAFGPHTLDGLCEAYDRLKEEDPSTLVVTATNKTKNPEQLDAIGQEWKVNEHPDFSCFMITPEFVEKFGYISEEYIPAFFEDNDTHHKLLLMGYKAWSTDWAPYSHIASRTRYAHPDIVSHEQFRNNRKQFYKTLMVDDPEQSVQDDRYKNWLTHHPDQPHPNWKEVLEWCDENGLL